MIDLIQSLQTGSASAWLFFPTAIFLGVLHGLEPGHSKTMMAAFIIAIRGTPWQAALLGASAAFSHSLVIWALAAAGLFFGRGVKAEETEPYFQLASAAVILCFAAWMYWRTRRDISNAAVHAHAHGHGHEPAHCHCGHAGHEHHSHTLEFQDAHERAHARDIEKRFAGQTVTTGQIVLFGLTGGLIPCPAALTVLLICLQIDRAALGFALVWAFGIGLALTLVAAGVAAAWSLRKAQSRFGNGLDGLFRRAPYISCALLLVIGLYTGWHGWSALPR